MDFLTAAAAASPSYSPSASSGADPTAIMHSNGLVGRRGRERERSVVSRTTRRLVRAIVAFVFATVGAFVGAVTGALIGLATESGLFRGAGIGAISGAVYSLDVVESSIRIWHSNESGLRTVLYVVGVFSSLLSGRLVREKVGPAVQNAVQSQMSAINSPFIEVIDIFETGGTGGMSSDSVNKLPKIKITTKNMVDDSGEKICCSVCLQDFQVEERARSLPHCHHIFHLPCIDNWLVRHGSCPLCRRDI